MKDIPLIRELLDPFLTVGEAKVLVPLTSHVNVLVKVPFNVPRFTDAADHVAKKKEEPCQVG